MRGAMRGAIRGAMRGAMLGAKQDAMLGAKQDAMREAMRDAMRGAIPIRILNIHSNIKYPILKREKYPGKTTSSRVYSGELEMPNLKLFP
jgi:hypothetical protein